MSKDRMFKNWVDWLVSTKAATPETRIGLAHADTAEDDALVTKVFVPYLTSRGLKVAAQAAFSGLTIASAAADAQNAAARFRDAKVDLILPDLDFLRTFLLVQSTGAGRSQARYSVSDLGQLSLGVATSFYPPTFGATRGVTAYASDLTGNGIGTDHATLSPALLDCVNVYQAGGPPLPASGVERLADELQLAQFCEELALVSHVATIAGAHLNRASFVAAFDKVTGWSQRVALTAPLSFGPGKFDGADNYRVVEWREDCGGGNSCYAELAPFVKGRW
jgi:hypothetical protein